MDWAAREGHLEMVKWLHINRIEGCTTLALDWAAREGHLEVVKWLHDNRREGWIMDAMRGAAINGHLDVVKWLHANYSEGYKIDAMATAVGNGHLGVVKWLYKNDGEVDAQGAMKTAIRQACFDVVMYLHDERWEVPTFHNSTWTLAESYKKTGSLRLMLYIAARQPAAEMDPFYCLWIFNEATRLVSSRGDLAALQWLAESYLPDALMTPVVHAASMNGCLHILEWLFERHRNRVNWGCVELCWTLANHHTDVVEWLRMHAAPRAECVPMVLRSAGKAGNLGVVQWLCEEYDVDAQDAFVYAQSSCHWETARWLFENCELPIEGCTTWAMDTAARHGRLDMVKWLHANRREGCTTTAMDLAARDGHLEVVKWLHDNRNEGCTVKAMNGAAINGHLDVVKWLHENRSEGCCADTMADAAKNGHLEVVKWLHKHRSEVDTQFSMTKVIVNDRMDMVLYLHAERLGVFSFDENTVFRRLGWELTQWLIANYAEQVNGCAFEVPRWDWRFNEWCERINLQYAGQTGDFTLWKCDSAALRLGAH
ncbi:hypothetical protein BBJ28_00020071 [Nothophytophthora sp. Chile5]|nr:hypothetical protein BBJ28_00020071 [Nothophytophthora sp. Chile5]